MKRPRHVAWLILLLTMPLFSGCVYWRLNQFRNQLSAFPDFFRIEERDYPTLVAVRPILRPDDLGWLSGLAASSTETRDGRVVETYHFVKQYGQTGDDEQGRFDLIVPLFFNEQDRLAEIQSPARFAPILTEENFAEVFGPMGGGIIERSRHATGWTWEEHRVNIPVRAEIEEFFGIPFAARAHEEGTAYTYVFQLRGNHAVWNPSGWDLHLYFIFEPEEERVIYTHTYLGRLAIEVNLRETQNLVDISRL